MPATAYEGHTTDSASRIANQSPDDVARADRGPMVSNDFFAFASVEVDPFTITAKERGVAGNDITIQFANNGASQALSVSVTGSAITVNLATDAGSVVTSTASQVVTAVEASVPADALVGISVPVANAADLVVASGPHSLTGGDATFPGYASFLSGFPRHDGQGAAINSGGR